MMSLVASPAARTVRRGATAHGAARPRAGRPCTRSVAAAAAATEGAVSRSGVGLHTGVEAEITIRAAAAGEGRYFAIIDDDGTERGRVPCAARAVGDTRLSTALAAPAPGGGEDAPLVVQTCEHLLSALEACGIVDVRLELRGGREVPLLDGSASPWVDALREAGMGYFGGAGALPAKTLRLTRPVSVYEGDAFVVAMPTEGRNSRLSYGVDFPHLPAIGEQWHSLEYTFDADTAQRYADGVAPARTFTDAATVDALRAAGLIAGGSLENAMVASPDGGWLNPELVRFEGSEQARHKLLDLVGDLALAASSGALGVPRGAHVMAYKASHRLHCKLAACLAEACELDDGGAA